MFLKRRTSKVAYWDNDQLVVEDRSSFQWVDNVTNEQYSGWLKSMPEVIEFGANYHS